MSNEGKNTYLNKFDNVVMKRSN